MPSHPGKLINPLLVRDLGLNPDDPRTGLGAGIPVAGGIPVGGSMSDERGRMFFDLHRMKPLEWEYHREIAAQHVGMNRSPYFPIFNSEPLKAEAHHYEDIVSYHRPEQAAKHLAIEGNQGGAGFFSSLKHVLGMGVRGFKKFSQFVEPWLAKADVFKELPGVGRFVEPLATGLTKGLSIGQKIAAAAEESRQILPGAEEQVPARRAALARQVSASTPTAALSRPASQPL